LTRTDPLLDETYGQRVAIGGTNNDWFKPIDGFDAGGVAHGSFGSAVDDPCFVFYGGSSSVAAMADTVSHEVGHTMGLGHDGQIRFYEDISQDPPEAKIETFDYYGGHPDAPTPAHPGWAAIMGAGFGKDFSQWSKGEYPNADNIQDDLLIITTTNGGVTYRVDDRGNEAVTADPLDLDTASVDSDFNVFADEGIIERNDDIDYFSFTVEGLGEIISLEVHPFHNGPNLDILAKLWDSDGNLLATADDIDIASAFFDEQIFTPGTYYVSIEGTGRPITFIDPIGHPDLYDVDGNIEDTDPREHVPDASDWGYSDYGSLGYYSVTGTRKRGLVVGVDFDEEGGLSPDNWTLYSGGDTQIVLDGLVSESGESVPYELTISTDGVAFEAVASDNPIDPADLPNHLPALDEVSGYIAAEDETWTFTWSNLAPETVYQVYVFGHASDDVRNIVSVVGGVWNGVPQTFNFTQDVSADGLDINGTPSANQDLTTFSLLVISNELGEITIDVTNEEGFEAAIAGLAIAPTKVGTIDGEKWNDVNGNQTKDPTEEGLEGWVVYLDLNNDGILNSTSDQNVGVVAPDLPQPLQDLTAVKSELFVSDVGQIVDIDVSLSMTHTYNADMKVTLISPSGQRVVLFQDAGGSSDNFILTTLDDEAATDIGSGSGPFTGSFRPLESLAILDGEDAHGIWQLELFDDAPNDTGVLTFWSVSIKLAGVFLEPFQETDVDGKYAFSDLPAGQYIVREHFSEDQTLEGWNQTWAPSPVTVRSGADIHDIDFGNWIPVAQHGSIHGQKFEDLDGDGVKDPLEPGLDGWIMYVDSNENGVRDIASTPTVIGGGGGAIDDFSTTASQVTVNNLGTVFSIQVTLDVTHSFVGDLDAFLVSPSGRQVELFTGVGGQYNDLDNLTLDDGATRSIATIGVDDLPYTGTWKPEGLLSDFIGEDAAGIWTLVIRDTAFADEGTLNNWSLKLTSGELFRTTDGNGNYQINDLPAGQYIVREEQKPGWLQVPPDDTDIPGAEWTTAQWEVGVVAVDDPDDPDGPDSHRNVKNVNFSNQALQALGGDFDRSGFVDASDYNLWRRTVGTNVTPFDGADGDGDGIVDSDDYGIWRSNFGSYLDDHGNSAPIATGISAVPGNKPGVIEVPGDVDWFSFTAAVGSTYDIETSLGSLADSVLRLIAADGVTELALNDNSVGLESLITWTAPANGVYFAEVRAASGQTGSYDFSVSLSGADDHGNDASLATNISLPSTTGGEVESSFDVDWFKFTAVSGTMYQFDTVLGTLPDSELRLFAPDGTTELAYDDDGGPGFASRINWMAPASGDYYLEVGGYGSDFGTYSLTTLASGAGSGSALPPAAQPLLTSAPAASSQLAAAFVPSAVDAPATGAVLDFAVFDSEWSAANGTIKESAAATGTAVRQANSDEALVAWIQSLNGGKIASSYDDEDGAAGEVGDGDAGLFDSVDSIFDELGDGALAAGCAV
jgi:subtilisin-like proprotein convertase family protein